MQLHFLEISEENQTGWRTSPKVIKRQLFPNLSKHNSALITNNWPELKITIEEDCHKDVLPQYRRRIE
ncbi:hypothetical protein EUGRSUZ_A02081 [Eucalyptus grandis]|uniref:Uncharacterized protein n=2 Tax=Eucalyptus grandis TaxID=71139 RepID=A0ACC3M4Y0_EUCGR|nr:hypothetical protein EUGRSUZ_A02081 [Eucalyptus grandis]